LAPILYNIKKDTANESLLLKKISKDARVHKDVRRPRNDNGLEIGLQHVLNAFKTNRLKLNIVTKTDQAVYWKYIRF